MNPLDLVTHAGSNPLFLVAALFLGALHGLEPGHSKGMMAAFIIGTRGTYAQAIVLALCATLSHTAIVWLLAWPASYGGAIWASDEIMPYLNLISGVVILALAYWMLRRLNRAHGHHHHGDHSHDTIIAVHDINSPRFTNTATNTPIPTSIRFQIALYLRPWNWKAMRMRARTSAKLRRTLPTAKFPPRKSPCLA